MNKKEIVRIDENQLKQIVTESVKRVLNENYDNYGEFQKEEENGKLENEALSQLFNVCGLIAKIYEFYGKKSQKLMEIYRTISDCRNELEDELMQCYRKRHTVHLSHMSNGKY